MDSFDRPIVKSSYPQRAAIANSLTEHLPCITEVIAIFPSHPCHIPKMLWLGAAQTERDQRFALFWKLVRTRIHGFTLPRRERMIDHDFTRRKPIACRSLRRFQAAQRYFFRPIL